MTSYDTIRRSPFYRHLPLKTNIILLYWKNNSLPQACRSVLSHPTYYACTRYTRNRLNVCFNKCTKWSEIREKRLTNKQLRERLDNIESIDEICNHRCLNWIVKLAVMPTTESENRLPRKLLGAWCYNCSCLRGGQRENTRKT